MPYTFAPKLSKTLAVASPIPLETPVTTHTLSLYPK